MSYTDELTEEIGKEYLANPSRDTVNTIASRIDKTPRSVIAKLSSMGIYKTPERVTKTGDNIVKKEELVKDMETWFQISLDTLVKAGKEDLKKLHKAIQDRTMLDEAAILRRNSQNA